MARAICTAAALVLAALSSAVARAAPPTAKQQERPLADAAQEHLPANWRWLNETVIAGNEVWRLWGLFLSILAALIVGRLFRFALGAAARRFEAGHRHLTGVTLRALSRASVFVLLVLGLQLGLEFLNLNETVERLADSIVRVLITTAVGYTAWCLVSVVDEWLRQISEKAASKLGGMLAPLVSKSLRASIVILALVQIATILSDKPATSIIAGLGIGGLAVGLAAQDTIKNFFGSIMIFSDRPFEMGDAIIVDGRDGSVETVGFRSTRLRTPDGYLLTIPNGDLANKAIVNVSRRPNLLRKMNLLLPLDLSAEKTAQALAIVKAVLEQHEGMNDQLPPRVFFSDFTPGGLALSINYWYHPPDWWKFMEFGERVNFEILRRFEAEGIRLVDPQPPGAPPRS
jgi:MscS family membrane protein